MNNLLSEPKGEFLGYSFYLSSFGTFVSDIQIADHGYGLRFTLSSNVMDAVYHKDKKSTEDLVSKLPEGFIVVRLFSDGGKSYVVF